MYELGQTVITKKKHPCGGDRWEVVRIGADYKIKCLTCNRVVMLTADEMKKRIKSVITVTDGKE